MGAEGDGGQLGVAARAGGNDVAGGIHAGAEAQPGKLAEQPLPRGLVRLAEARARGAAFHRAAESGELVDAGLDAGQVGGDLGEGGQGEECEKQGYAANSLPKHVSSPSWLEGCCC